MVGGLWGDLKVRGDYFRVRVIFHMKFQGFILKFPLSKQQQITTSETHSFLLII